MRRVIKDPSVKLAVAVRETGKHEFGLAFGVHRRSGAALGTEGGAAEPARTRAAPNRSLGGHQR